MVKKMPFPFKVREHLQHYGAETKEICKYLSAPIPFWGVFDIVEMIHFWLISTTCVKISNPIDVTQNTKLIIPFPSTLGIITKCCIKFGTAYVQ